MIDIKDLFTSPTFNQSVLDKFDTMIPTIHRAPEAQKAAKDKAMAAFEKFKEAIQTMK